jgi:hypothetical protein
LTGESVDDLFAHNVCEQTECIQSNYYGDDPTFAKAA